MVPVSAQLYNETFTRWSVLGYQSRTECACVQLPDQNSLSWQSGRPTSPTRSQWVNTAQQVYAGPPPKSKGSLLRLSAATFAFLTAFNKCPLRDFSRGFKAPDSRQNKWFILCVGYGVCFSWEDSCCQVSFSNFLEGADDFIMPSNNSVKARRLDCDYEPLQDSRSPHTACLVYFHRWVVWSAGKNNQRSVTQWL